MPPNATEVDKSAGKVGRSEFLPPRLHALGPLLWAVLLPLLTMVAAFLAELPWLQWAPAAIALVASVVVAIVGGGLWHRAGAAVLAATTTLALGLFAGPTLYETYIKLYGDRVDALVADTDSRVNLRIEQHVCRVVDTSGTIQDLSRGQNCRGQFQPRQHIVLFKDPLGFFDPWAEDRDDRSLDALSLSCVGGLFIIATSTLCYAGVRRR